MTAKTTQLTELEYFIHVTLGANEMYFNTLQFLRSVSESTGFSIESIKGDSRKAEIVAVRRLIACTIYKQGRLDGQKTTYERIGALLGGRDHATIGVSINRAKFQRGFYKTQDRYERLFNSLGYYPF